jgi:queuine/archaeosine tRNA-ribosyltransferase
VSVDSSCTDIFVIVRNLTSGQKQRGDASEDAEKSTHRDDESSIHAGRRNEPDQNADEEEKVVVDVVQGEFTTPGSR